MKHSHLQEMVNGWFVGGFTPSALQTQACEVAVKTYVAGAREAAHFHRVATEVTLVVSGRIRMAGQEWGPGDIIVLEPGEVTDFESLSDSVNVVVKVPGAPNDKFIVDY